MWRTMQPVTSGRRLRHGFREAAFADGICLDTMPETVAHRLGVSKTATPRDGPTEDTGGGPNMDFSSGYAMRDIT